MAQIVSSWIIRGRVINYSIADVHLIDATLENQLRNCGANRQMTSKTSLPGLPPLVLFAIYPAALALPLALAALSDLPPVSPWLEAGSATGLVAAVGLAVQFITSGRFEKLSGRVGIDVTMAFHKWLSLIHI